MSRDVIDGTDRGPSLSFATSFVATMAVAVAPSFVAFGFLVWSRPDPRPVLATVVSILLTFGALILGSKVWDRQPESAGFSFADLMLWQWMRREWAEEKLVRNARMLGYDRNGRFVGKSKISPERQLQAAREIGAALDAKSSYTINHAKRVEAHTRDIASVLGLSDKQTEELATAAALHDIGNLRVPEHVARKTGSLTLEERSTIEGHVLLGAIMAFDAVGDDIVQGLRHHHERWDGNGYPSGLTAEDIPLYARIIGIAEAYDAMTSTRPYRQSFTRDQAVAVLRSEGGSQFDPDLVEVFVSTLPEGLEIVDRFPVLAWAERQIRELAILFRRVGGVAMSAAASTVAIALILGTAVIKPDAFGGRTNSPFSRPDNRVANQGTVNGNVLRDETLLAAVENRNAAPMGIAESAATAPLAVGETRPRTLAVEVLGERISIETPSQGSVIAPAENEHDNGNGNGGSDNGNGQPGGGDDPGTGGGSDDDGEPTPGPSPIDPTPTPGGGSSGGGNSGGGSSGGGNTGGGDTGGGDTGSETGGGTTNPPPDTTPGNGNGNGKGKDKGERGNSGNAPGHNKDVIAGPGNNNGNGHGKDKSNNGNGKGKGNNDSTDTVDDGVTPSPSGSPGNSGNAPGQSKDKEKDKGGSESTGGSGSTPDGAAGSSDGGSAAADDAPGNSGNAPGKEKKEKGSEESAGSSDSGSSSSSGGDTSGSSDSGSSSAGASDSGSSGSSDSGSSDSGSSNSNGNGNAKEKEKGKEPDSGPGSSNDSGSSSGTGSSSSPGNSGSAPGHSEDKGKGKDKDTDGGAPAA
ncbi:MAG TPA: HD-GYP domain-containing protein [Actinomycetota bacterium]|nr:HD-GYP domain-containing protein [Actinomycetota bacterium]